MITVSIKLCVVFVLILLFLFTICVTLIYKYIKLKTEYELDKSDMLNHKNKVSMVEYMYRQFREGENPYTVLRNISNVLKDIYPTLHRGDTPNGNK